MSKRNVIVIIVVVGIVALLLSLRQCGRNGRNGTGPVASATPSLTPEALASATPEPVSSPSPVAIPRPSTSPSRSPKPAATPTPPPVQLHTELIPKDIEIVRVYYPNQITGPDSTLEFDINGTGFNAEFQRMIEVESGLDGVTIRDLRLITPNQIHGTLVISADAKTQAAFPRVLIQKKPVFQAPEPYAVIRPGEVLNLIFTEMGENGRTGRFRMFTNLTQEMFERLQIHSSTTAIGIGNLVPNLPFQVAGMINIGGAPGGNYDLDVELDGKSLWRRDGIIRVVHPNVGDTGLVQRLDAADPFCRPGEKVAFVLQGSGFQPKDVGTLHAFAADWAQTSATFTFVSPGRLDLAIWVPPAVQPGTYAVRVKSVDTSLVENPSAFTVVPVEWLRRLQLEEPLRPGSSATLILSGRDMSPAFIKSLRSEVDDAGLSVSSFTYISADQANSRVRTGPSMAPGDYLLKLSSHGKPVVPRDGSIIRIETSR